MQSREQLNFTEVGPEMLNATFAAADVNATATEIPLSANETASDSIEEELGLFRFYTQGVIVTPVSVFGIIGESSPL